MITWHCLSANGPRPSCCSACITSLSSRTVTTKKTADTEATAPGRTIGLLVSPSCARMTGFLFIAPYTVADAFIVTLWLLYKCFAHTDRAWKFSRTEPNNPALMEHEILLEIG